MPTKFEVNGKAVEVDVEPRMSLADCLRHELHLTGTHLACEHGVCGACTVLVDGEAEIEHRHQALPAREHVGLVAVGGQGVQSFVKRAWAQVIEGSGFHGGE